MAIALEKLQLGKTQVAMRKIDGRWNTISGSYNTKILYDGQPLEIDLGTCLVLRTSPNYTVFEILDKNVVQQVEWLRECLQLKHESARVVSFVNRWKENQNGGSGAINPQSAFDLMMDDLETVNDKQIDSFRLYGDASYHRNFEYNVVLTITHLYQVGTDDASIQFRVKSICLKS